MKMNAFTVSVSCFCKSGFLSVLAVEKEIAAGSGSPTSYICAPDITVSSFWGFVF